MNVEQLLQQSDRLFQAQSAMLPTWQTMATHFLPQRADFTVNERIGKEFADYLVDSYPVIMNRDLSNSLGAMLRDGQDWFSIGVQEQADWNGRIWLQEKGPRLATLMYDRKSGFVRSTNQGDQDYSTFGQCVLSVEPDMRRAGILVRNWHLRDCAWEDDESGQVGQVHRRWEPTLYDLNQYFKGKIHDNYQALISQKKGDTKAPVLHVVMPSDRYGKDEFSRFEYVSVFIDRKHMTILEEKGINYRYYVVPRWQTIAGSPYAYSVATVAGLPNARTLQAMTHTLLEAAERMARPPIIATQRAVRSDVDLGPDGMTWVDDKYDEKLGASLRPLFQDKGGFPFGQDMRAGVVEVMSSAFYLDKINLPPIDHQMTAYEVSERMKQFRRENLPLFAPMENDYNGQLCEACFDVALSFGLLGPLGDIPTSLSGQDVEFSFKSPIRAQEEERKAEQFMRTSEMLATAAQFDPGVKHNVNIDEAFQDAVAATGAPLTWLNDLREVAQGRQQDQMMQAAQMAAEQQQAAA